MLGRLVRGRPLSIAYVGLVAIGIVLSGFIPESGSVPTRQTIGDPGAATLEFVTQLVQLMTAINTAMLGAAGTLLMKSKEWRMELSLFDGILLLLIFSAGAASYYGVYLGHVAVLENLQSGVVSLIDRRLHWAMDIQYYGTLGGIFLLGLVVIQQVDRRVKQPRGR